MQILPFPDRKIKKKKKNLKSHEVNMYDPRESELERLSPAVCIFTRPLPLQPPKAVVAENQNADELIFLGFCGHALAQVILSQKLRCLQAS